jgi:hypothetical protein
MSELDTVRRVIDLMTDTFGQPGPDATFRKYFDGDPERIATFDLPALIVTQTGEDTVQGAYAQDDVTDRLTIKVVLNKADDFTGDAVDPLNMTERKIREFIGRRDKKTKGYANGTIKHALRNGLLDGVTAIAPEMTVEYGINPRQGGEGLVDITSEGHVNFSITYVIDTE